MGEPAVDVERWPPAV